MRTPGRSDWALDLLEDIARRNDLLDVLKAIAETEGRDENA